MFINGFVNMNSYYIIFEKADHTSVFMIRAGTEQEAWKRYLEVEHEYVEQPDGSFRHKERFHNSLQDALDTYGLVRISPMSFQDSVSRVYETMDSAFAAYGIIERPDDTFSSTDITYPNLETILVSLRQDYRDLTLQKANFEVDASFQLLFSSRDELADIVETSKSDIAKEHAILADYYEARNDIKSALQELRKCIKLDNDRRRLVSYHWEIARLLRQVGKVSQAVNHYKHALKLCAPSGNREQIAYLLATAFDELGDSENALSNYELALSIDPNLDDKQQVLTRIGELRGNYQRRK
jgi:tetratricopeptide (TPR) repeat protein